MQNNVILIPALPFPKPEEIFGPVVKVSRSETHKFTSDVGECVSSKFVMMRNLAQAVWASLCYFGQLLFFPSLF